MRGKLVIASDIPDFADRQNQRNTLYDNYTIFVFRPAYQIC